MADRELDERQGCTFLVDLGLVLHFLFVFDSIAVYMV